MTDTRHKSPGHRFGGRKLAHMLTADEVKLPGGSRHTRLPHRRGIGFGEPVLSATDQKILESRLGNQQRFPIGRSF
jgi:hypothetical protein